jgi:hypothetical protein
MTAAADDINDMTSPHQFFRLVLRLLFCSTSWTGRIVERAEQDAHDSGSRLHLTRSAPGRGVRVACGLEQHRIEVHRDSPRGLTTGTGAVSSMPAFIGSTHGPDGP